MLNKVRPPKNCTFNYEVGVDGFYLKDVSYNMYQYLNIVCRGTGYQMTVCMKYVPKEEVQKTVLKRLHQSGRSITDILDIFLRIEDYITVGNLRGNSRQMML